MSIRVTGGCDPLLLHIVMPALIMRVSTVHIPNIIYVAVSD